MVTAVVAAPVDSIVSAAVQASRRLIDFDIGLPLSIKDKYSAYMLIIGAFREKWG